MPLVLRHIPIWQNDVVTGFIDLALERAFVYREHAASEVLDLTGEDKGREVDARFHMLETLADYDDELMEQLLNEIEPTARQGFHRPGQGNARRRHLPGADRLGRQGQRRRPAAQGDPPRVARHRRHARTPRL